MLCVLVKDEVPPCEINEKGEISEHNPGPGDIIHALVDIIIIPVNPVGESRVQKQVITQLSEVDYQKQQASQKKS
jgi:hypothetical protein